MRNVLANADFSVNMRCYIMAKLSDLGSVKAQMQTFVSLPG
jgi:hypothetical protein